MPKITVEGQAKAIAARVDSNAVGFDPATIIIIFTAVLPLLLKCFQKEDQQTPDQVNAAIKSQHEKNPARLLRRTTVAVRRESPKKMTRSQAEIMAQAMIDEAVSATPQRTAALCNAVN